MNKKQIDDIVSDVGNLKETDGLVRNEAAKNIEHLFGKKTALMLGETISDLKLNPMQYSAVFKDKGLRLKAVGAIAEKARVTDFPSNEESIYVEFEEFMNYCDTFMISPTIGLFATWLGVDLDEFEAKVKHYKTIKPYEARALEVCKEILRGFLETKALDGDIAPAIYLHQNKSYYDAVENAPRHVETTSDAHIRDVNQIEEIIDLLPK